LLASGELIALKLEDAIPDNELFIAWKTVNKEKGLKSLIDFYSTAIKL